VGRAKPFRHFCKESAALLFAALVSTTGVLLAESTVALRPVASVPEAFAPDVSPVVGAIASAPMTSVTTRR
jgi:hypothetical protein